VRRFADGSIKKITQLTVHSAHRASRSSNPASRGSSRNLASARAAVLFTFPTEQFRIIATCASGRSSKTRSKHRPLPDCQRPQGAPHRHSYRHLRRHVARRGTISRPPMPARLATGGGSSSPRY
jgi:hypothetical protein